MRVPIYQIDAFTDRCSAAIRPAVVPLERWLPDVTNAGHRSGEQPLGNRLLRAGWRRLRLRSVHPATESTCAASATLATATCCCVTSSTRIGSGSPSPPAAAASRSAATASELSMDFPAYPPRTRGCARRALRRPSATSRGVLRSHVLDGGSTVDEPGVRAAQARSDAMVRATPGQRRSSLPAGQRRLRLRVAPFARRGARDPRGPADRSAHCNPWCRTGRATRHDQAACRQVSRRGASLACELRGDAC